MYIIATASADTYITNKIIDGSRVEDANVGRAGTLDLFKLYNETISGSTGNHTELSRLLLKFDLSRVISLSTGTLDVMSSNFGAYLRLKQVGTNLPVPQNFTVSIFPLAKPFDEGYGRDVASFTDVDACNYISASSQTLWNLSGAYAYGALTDTNIDYYASGNLLDGQGVRSLEKKQTFMDGNEDLFVDVTEIVSATICNIIPNHGFILSFTSSQESDQVTRFVKRFASRHVVQDHLRPRLEVFSNTSIFDAHSNSFFDATGSLYLRNFVGSSQQNLLSASTEVVGESCLRVVLSTGSYSKIITASQELVGNNRVTGSYSGSFYISAQDTSVVSGTITLADHISSTGSIVFTEKWQSTDGSVTFYTTALTCSLPTRSFVDSYSRQLVVKSTNAQHTYKASSCHRIKIFCYDPNYEPSASKVQKSTKSLYPEIYYRVKDIEGNEYVPFERVKGGTRVSNGVDNLFFDLYTDGLPQGKLLTFDYLVIDRGVESIVEDKNVKFKVEI